MVNVYRDGKFVETLNPGYAFYPAHSMAATRAGIRTTPTEDLYIIASEFSDEGSGSALFRVYVNPLVVWMWVAGPLMVLGTVVALWPESRRAASSVVRMRETLAGLPQAGRESVGLPLPARSQGLGSSGR